MTFPRFLAVLPLIALAACVPKPAPTLAPTQAPVPAPTPTPAPIPTPPPFAGSWMDAPITPGDWRYTFDTPSDDAASGSYARFRTDGGAVFDILCFPRQRMVRLSRAGSTVQETGTRLPMTIRAETAEQAFNATQTAGGVFADLDSHDPFLDAMAFSKGRFAVEVAGLPTLYVPSYPEVTRVIEDCR